MTVRLLIGDCRDVLPTLPANSVHCVVTSPPYWGLRDYDVAGQLGLEKTPDEYVAKMVAVFREVRRVLRDDGTLWLNLGDSYASGEIGRHDKGRTSDPSCGANEKWQAQERQQSKRPNGLKPKDLVGIPWRVAFALQADGWYLRSDIIWHKPNPMPESVTDRPTKAHEYLFLLTQSASYFYDADAIKEPASEFLSTTGKPVPRRKYNGVMPAEQRGGFYHRNGDGDIVGEAGKQSGYVPRGGDTRNRRSVWTVATRPYKGAHFATFPPKLIEPCILAGTSPQACEHCAAPWERVTERTAMVLRRSERTHSMGHTRSSGTMLEPPTSTTVGWQPTCDCADNTGSARCVVLDPFGGAGTTGLVADRLGRDAILIELNKEYTELGTDRITDDAPLFANVHVGNGNGHV